MKNIKKILMVFLLACAPILAWDSDGDGIPNKYDECKKQAEDMDGFQDQDGCPELDNDKDGVNDTEDKCVMVPEDRDGFEDSDGCPDKDNDKDGILDVKDKCPLKQEDFDSYKDMDGCPDLDNDNDGVLDQNDGCPSDAEDKDGFQDNDGCPEYDNDKDGIKDVADKCPNKSETFNDVDDDDGCPDLGILPIPKFQRYKDVSFRTRTKDLTFESYRSLDSLGQKLSIFKTIKIRIRMFNEFAGDPEVELVLLGEQQKALVDYLISKGGSPDQFVLVPYHMDWYESVKGTHKDPNGTRPIEIYVVDPSELVEPAPSAPSPTDGGYE